MADGIVGIRFAAWFSGLDSYEDGGYQSFYALFLVFWGLATLEHLITTGRSYVYTDLIASTKITRYVALLFVSTWKHTKKIQPLANISPLKRTLYAIGGSGALFTATSLVVVICGSVAYLDYQADAAGYAVQHAVGYILILVNSKSDFHASIRHL
jgi:hypothetical protein